MSGRLCCYKQQQHSVLLAQFVFKVSTFCFNTRTKMPLPDCRVNNTLIQFVPSCHYTRTQFVDVLDPPFSDIACSIILCLVVGIFVPKNSIVTKFCHLALGGLVIMPHHVHRRIVLSSFSHQVAALDLAEVCTLLPLSVLFHCLFIFSFLKIYRFYFKFIKLL